MLILSYKDCLVKLSFLAVHRGSTVSANKALELVRAALQPSLNAEIEAVLKSYQEVIIMINQVSEVLRRTV